MSDETLWTLVRADIGSVIAALGGFSLIMGGLGGWLGGWLKDRHLASYKARLDSEADIQKAELAATTERVKAELSREAELHKLALRKSELVFNRQVEAAGAFAEVFRTFNVAGKSMDLPFPGWIEFAQTSLENLQERFKCFNNQHLAVLPQEVREQAAFAIESLGYVVDSLRDPESEAEISLRAKVSSLRAVFARLEQRIYALILD